jgi:hypothetical protein
MVLNVYVLLKTRKTLTKPLDVAEYTKHTHRVIKIFRWGRLILFIFFSLWLVYVGTLNLIHFGLTEKGIGILCGCIIFDIVLASFYYVIDEVFVKPDVEITLEGVLKDLES